MGNFILLSPDYFEANTRHFVEFTSRTCHLASLIFGSGGVMLLGGPLEQSFSSTALGCVSCLGQFPSLEDQVMLAQFGEISAGGPVSRSEWGKPVCESLSDRTFLGEGLPKALAFMPWLPQQDWDSLLSVPTWSFLLSLGCPLAGGRVGK